MIGIESFLYDTFIKVTENILSDTVRDKLKAILSGNEYKKLYELATEEKEKEFKEYTDLILKENTDIKNKLIELQKEPNDSIQQDIRNNYGTAVGKIDTQNIDTQNIVNNHGAPLKNYEENYNKAIKAMGKGLYPEAIVLLDEFIREVDNRKDAQLLKISCQLSEKRIDKISDHLADSYFNVINKNFLNNYLGLIILGILHIDYYNAKCRIPPKGLSLDDILIKIKDTTDINDYSFALNSIQISLKAKQKLNL